MENHNLENGILVFDVFGRRAMWRRFYTNSSSLSYPLPTRTALSGLVSAILGEDFFDKTRESYSNYFDIEQAVFGIQTFSKLRSSILVENKEIDNKIKNNDITQINTEYYLNKEDKDIHYRIYFTHKNKKLFDLFEKKLREQTQYYPIFLGKKNCGADFKFIEKIEPNKIHKLENYKGELNVSLINRKNRVYIQNKSFEPDIMPLALDTERNCLQTHKVAYTDENLTGEFKNIYKVKDKHISFYQE